MKYETNMKITVSVYWEWRQLAFPHFKEKSIVFSSIKLPPNMKEKKAFTTNYEFS